MLPPLCYAVFGIATPCSPVASASSRARRRARRPGRRPRRSRPAPSAGWLLAASTLTFAAIGVGNVLLPPLVKRYFPDRIGLLTTIYVTAMSVSTFLPPLVAVPVADAAGWRVSLGVWAVVALTALVPWIALLVHPRRRSRRAPEEAEPGLLRHAFRSPWPGRSRSCSRSPDSTPTRCSPGCRRSSRRPPDRRRPRRARSCRCTRPWACPPHSRCRSSPSGEEGPLAHRRGVVASSPAIPDSCSPRPPRRGSGSRSPASRRCCSRSRSCSSTCARARIPGRSRSAASCSRSATSSSRSARSRWASCTSGLAGGPSRCGCSSPRRSPQRSPGSWSRAPGSSRTSATPPRAFRVALLI